MRQWTLQGSDPMGRDLVLVDGEGRKIEHILELTLRATPSDGMRVEVEIVGVPVNVQVFISEVTFVCPSCSEYVGHDCTPQTLGGNL